MRECGVQDAGMVILYNKTGGGGIGVLDPLDLGRFMGGRGCVILCREASNILHLEQFEESMSGGIEPWRC